MTDSFILTRILGNDLPPRHGGRQTIANLAFILDNEAAFPNCVKRWVVNRIADREREAAVIALLQAHGQPFVRIPFELAEYARCLLDSDALPADFNALAVVAGEVQSSAPGQAFEWIHRHKNRYAINVNGARNVALDDGIAAGGRWILPWDGACFLTADAFGELAAAAASNPEARYLIVPMARRRDNAVLLRRGFRPDATPDEPQMAFRNDAGDRFDPSLRYGHQPKAELLRRLGVPGPWQKWKVAAWEPVRPMPVKDAGRFVFAGWVARLDPEAADAVEVDASSRWRSRHVGVAAHCARLDQRVVADAGAVSRLHCYGPLLASLPPDSARARAIVAAADAFRAMAPISVTEKPALPPGVLPNDYVSIRRYARQKPDGTWGTEDGVSNPAAERGGAGSENYDRFRLQTMIDAVTALALAGTLTGDSGHGAHAAAFVRAWFIAPQTRMNPHLRFAQILPDRPNAGAIAGLIDFRDIWALADALQILRSAGALDAGEWAAVAAWFAAFRDDMLVRAAAGAVPDNNIGIFHDLLLASAAAVADDDTLLAAIIARAPLRFRRLIGPWGRLPLEAVRTLPLHYSLFALQGMIALAWFGRSAGVDLWAYAGSDQRSIPMVAHFIANQRATFADYAIRSAACDDRIEAALRAIPRDAAGIGAIADIPRRTITMPAVLDMAAGFAPWTAYAVLRDAEIAPP